MAFTQVQVTTPVTNNGASGTTMAVSIAGVTPGNALLIFAPSYNPNGVQSVTANGFVAKTFPLADGSCSGNILVLTNSAGGTVNITLNVGSYSYTRVTIIEVTGLAAAPVDLLFGNSTTTGATNVTATSTSPTAQADEVLVGLMWIAAGGYYPTQTGFTTLYVDDTSGPSSQAAFITLNSIQTPSETWSSNDPGYNSGLMFVSLKLANNSIAASASVNGSTSVTASEKTTVAKTAMVGGGVHANASITLQGSYNAHIFGGVRLTTKFANQYINGQVYGGSSVKTNAGIIVPNQVSVLPGWFDTQTKLNAAWDSPSVKVQCDAGDAIIVLTAQANVNNSGTYYPTLSSGAGFNLIADQSSGLLGTAAPVYGQMFGAFNVPAGTYTVTPPNLGGSRGFGDMIVLRIKGIIGVRPNTLAAVRQYDGTTTYTSLNYNSGSGVQLRDYLLSITYAYDTQPVTVFSTVPLNTLAQVTDTATKLAAVVTGATAQSVGTQALSVGWNIPALLAGSIAVAFIPSVGGRVSAALIGSSRASASFIRANPLSATVHGNAYATSRISEFIYRSAHIRGSAVAMATMFDRMFFASGVGGRGRILASTSFDVTVASQVRGSGFAYASGQHLQHATVSINGEGSIGAAFGQRMQAMVRGQSYVQTGTVAFGVSASVHAQQLFMSGRLRQGIVAAVYRGSVLSASASNAARALVKGHGYATLTKLQTQASASVNGRMKFRVLYTQQGVRASVWSARQAFASSVFGLHASVHGVGRIEATPRQQWIARVFGSGYATGSIIPGKFVTAQLNGRGSINASTILRQYTAASVHSLLSFSAVPLLQIKASAMLQGTLSTTALDRLTINGTARVNGNVLAITSYRQNLYATSSAFRTSSVVAAAVNRIVEQVRAFGRGFTYTNVRYAMYQKPAVNGNMLLTAQANQDIAAQAHVQGDGFASSGPMLYQYVNASVHGGGAAGSNQAVRVYYDAYVHGTASLQPTARFSLHAMVRGRGAVQALSNQGIAATAFIHGRGRMMANAIGRLPITAELHGYGNVFGEPTVYQPWANLQIDGFYIVDLQPRVFYVDTQPE